ncbi:MAG TPA: O-methyltransferase [Candidatus Limenecus avicola]|mgnify:FL=1|uniref:O-methyltransferase n=1 Tax=Candidatus Limenecus avicola TaxID=2840847 RepID=A0A9D1MY36_9CLOT|nr:O-methyltransferase [Candidatus Limenecus avicola]
MDAVALKISHELELTQHEFWNISHQTAEFISMLIKISAPKNVLEIGTSNGYSALWIADALKSAGNKGHLTTIEFYEKRQSIARENIEKCALSDFVTFKQGRALEILANLDFVPDMVFIDANKSEYIQYFDLLKDKLPKGGIILADNVVSHAAKVADFLEEIKNDTRYQSQVLDLPAGLLMALKLTEN